ncbi:MAG: hypothetical protein BMS9Abin31_0672 [Gammaproteobacteria bacterium]|nr:MAG: hypothetical protein BMS9Abin31_0672 [Gammaproteobacteria bacterium]
MKGSVTGKNITVEIDNKYVQVTDFEDYDCLKDELTEKYEIEPFAEKRSRTNINIDRKISHAAY